MNKIYRLLTYFKLTMSFSFRRSPVFQHKVFGLLLLLFFLIYTTNNNAETKKESRILIVPVACYTVEDCSQEISDPFKGFNKAVFRCNEVADKYVLKPISTAYDKVLPSFVKRGVSNFFSNIGEPSVVFNSLLQGKGASTSLSLTRFLINSSFGIFGIFDVAGALGVKKYKEDFGQTLAFYGVKPGPYIVLPLLGPSSLRNAMGLLVDFQTKRVFYSESISYVSGKKAFAVEVISIRTKLLGKEKIVSDASLNAYEFWKNSYVQNRSLLIFDGKIPEIKKQKTKEDVEEEESLDSLLE